MKKIVFFLLISFGALAQTGIGTNSPNTSAKLDVSSSTLGFLPPRVALTATNSFSPLAGIAANATGLIVYNTAIAGTAPNNVVPGYYFWNGSAWINFIASNTSTGLTNDQTGTSYTLTSADNGKIITLNNAGAITLNVPYFFVGFNCMVLQKGAGQVTLAINGTTTNIYNRYNFTKTAGQYSILTLVCTDANKYVASGDMTN
ncbi:hypothetical protein SKC37_07745 [Aquirufa sp. HETE-83D]|uniref:Uncharacterized protein n=1 Tax=Aquirufa esocilacus TaxID=3096513 RepID=A0ABW6DMJ2_9BACT